MIAIARQGPQIGRVWKKLVPAFHCQSPRGCPRGFSTSPETGLHGQSVLGVFGAGCLYIVFLAVEGCGTLHLKSWRDLETWPVLCRPLNPHAYLRLSLWTGRVSPPGCQMGSAMGEATGNCDLLKMFLLSQIPLSSRFSGVLCHSFKSEAPCLGSLQVDLFNLFFVSGKSCALASSVAQRLSAHECNATWNEKEGVRSSYFQLTQKSLKIGEKPKEGSWILELEFMVVFSYSMEKHSKNYSFPVQS